MLEIAIYSRYSIKVIIPLRTKNAHLHHAASRRTSSHHQASFVLQKRRGLSQTNHRRIESSLCLLLAKLHEGVINLLYDLTLGVIAVGLTFLGFPVDFPLDPEVGLAEAVGDLDGGFPSQLFLDEDIVGVATADAHRAVDVLDGKVLALEGYGNVSELVHAYHLGRSKVDGNVAVGEGKPEYALDAVVDESEGPGLEAVAPHPELLLRRDGLATEGGWSFLAAALPGPAGPVDVVKAGDADLEGEIPAVGQGHLLGVQLLEPVHVLGPGRPGVRLDKAGVGGVLLLGLIVDAGRRGVEKTGGAPSPGSLEHVHGDGRVVKAQHGLVRADESHSAHIGGQVVHLVAAGAGPCGHVQLAQVIVDEDVAELIVLHELVLLPIHHRHVVSVLLEALGDVRADEAGSPTDAYLGAVSGGEGKGCVFVAHLGCVRWCGNGMSWRVLGPGGVQIINNCL